MEQSLNNVRDALVASIGEDPTVHSAETKFVERLTSQDEMIGIRFRRMQRIIRLLGAENGIVLDAGAGNGLNAALSLLAGASEVYAVEINPQRYKCAASLFRRLDLDHRIHLVPDSILDADLPVGSMDGIYSLEFLEHIFDSSEFHRLCYGWLRPGGRVYGRTGANGANALKRRLVYRKVWDRIDAGYAVERKQMISSAAPDMPESALVECVEATRGLYGDEILDVVACWKETGDVRSACLPVPRQPHSGEFMERPRYPRELIRELEREGFQARIVRPDFGTLTINNRYRRLITRLAGACIAATHPLSLPVAPWLEVLGVKPG